MKRKLLIGVMVSASALFSTVSLKAQNEVYWREGFSTIGAPTSTPAGPSDVVRYDTSADIPAGKSWVSFGAYRTTGTACSFGTTQHIRFSGNVTSDTPYLITPIVNFGINELHFLRSRASRKYTFYTTTDTLGTTTNWTPVFGIGASTNTCVDTTIIINRSTARRLKITSTSLLDADIDSVWITSVTHILPVVFNSVTATASSNLVKVSWDIAVEINTAQYVVERSTNGVDFIPVGSLTATNSGKYNWIDNSPAAGVNAYRVKAIDKDGSFQYSAVVTININKTLSALSVYPNPVVGGQMNVQVSGFEKGTYTLQLLNMNGQVVTSKSLNLDGSVSSMSVQLPSSVITGIYQLQLTNGSTRTTKTVMVQ